MKKNLAFVFLILFFSCTETKLPLVEIETGLGNILIELDTIHAPVSSMNFLNLVRQESYRNASFYRVVRMDNQAQNNIKIEVIQGGLQSDILIRKYTPILHEPTQKTGLIHLDGVISMARMEPGTASTEFFICIGDQPELDFGGKRNPDGQGFAAFGKVVEGMEVVRKIQQLPENKQILINPVKINHIKMVDL